MNVLIIGCGKTGGAITKNLISIPYIKKIYLLSNLITNAEHLEKEINNSKVESINSLDNINRVDYAILALSKIPHEERIKSFKQYKTTHEIRQHELKFNFPSVKRIAEKLKPHSKKIKVIVVTNPSEEITNYLGHKLNHKNIIGFGAELDAKRYSRILGKKVFCLGPHGKAFPLINEKSHEVYESLLKKSDEEILNHLRGKGIQADFVGKVFKEFFNKLNDKNNTVHICKYLDKPFLGVKNIAISLPFTIRNGKINRPAKLKINKIEKERFHTLSKELKASVKNIIKKDYY